MCVCVYSIHLYPVYAYSNLDYVRVHVIQSELGGHGIRFLVAAPQECVNYPFKT